jgi:Bcr/CflA subfamily drug resistance transporter
MLESSIIPSQTSNWIFLPIRKNGLFLFLVLLLVALGQFAIDIYIPSFPSMVVAMDTSKKMIQLSLTFFLVTFACSQLIYGPLSERFGRRKVLCFGLIIFLIGAFWSAVTSSISAFLISRAMQGIGIGAANVLVRAILRDIYSDKELAIKVNYLGMVWVSSPIIAPVIGGYFEQYLGWRANFVFLILLVGMILIWAIFRLPETKDPSELHSIHPKMISKNYWTLLTNRFCMGYTLADFFVYGMFSAFYVAGPFLLQNRLKLSAVEFGWVMLIISMGYLIGSFSNMRIIRYFPARRMIISGLFITGIVSAIMVMLAMRGFMNLKVIVMPLFFMFLGMGFIFTNCIAGALSIYPNLAGHASALWGFFAYAGGTIATFVMSLLETNTQLPLSLLLFVQIILAAIVLITMVFRNPIPERF